MCDVQVLRAIAIPRPIPVLLSVVAGYVDSCTYLGLFGVFVAQATGSFVLAGTLFIKSEPGLLAKLFAIPFFFFAGMAVTVLVHSMRGRPRASLAWSLVIECLLLIGLLVLSWVGAPFSGPDTAGAIIALLFGMAAMGVQSALVRLLMRGVASTNVMTTNTTLLAINAAEILLGWIESSQSWFDWQFKSKLCASAQRVCGATPARPWLLRRYRTRRHRIYQFWIALRIVSDLSDREFGNVVHAPLVEIADPIAQRDKRAETAITPRPRPEDRKPAAGEMIEQVLFQCPLLAQSGHRLLHRTCPLSGVKRTSLVAARISAFDP